MSDNQKPEVAPVKPAPQKEVVKITKPTKKKRTKPISSMQTKLNNAEKSNKKIKLLLGIVSFCILLLVTGAVWSTVGMQFYMKTLKNEYVEAVESARQSVISGVFSVNKVIRNKAPTRAERLEVFMTRAKGIILQYNSESDLEDEDINRMLKINFDLSEQHVISPYIFLAFAATESNFMKTAESSTGARGIVQFMPSTMKILVGETYKDKIEFNPIEACRAWYRYFVVLYEATSRNLKWTAAAYLSPIAIQFMNQGKTIEEFMAWIVSQTENEEDYPFLIEKLSQEFSEALE